MKTIGFSVSPGGLLFPYHLGVLASLSYHGYITDQTHLAGSSAGAIAVAAHACHVDSKTALDASIRLSSRCNPIFLAKGQLMPSLQEELNSILDTNAHEIVNTREGTMGLAHYELFPEIRPRLQTEFESRDCLIDAICDSSMFPYFTTNKPWRTVKRKNKILPRMVVDGYFTEPFWRFGCPTFDDSLSVDRTVCISVAPKSSSFFPTLPASLLPYSSDNNDCNTNNNNMICPELETENSVNQVVRLGLMATTASKARSLIKLYDSGWTDAERWIKREERGKVKKLLP